MKHALALLVIAVGMNGCQKHEANTAQIAKPSDVIRQAYMALNNKDTAAYLATLSKGALDIYRAAPKRLAADLAYWKSNRFDVQILSESADADDAVVTYRVKVTGANPEQSTPSVVVYKEGDNWRITAPSLYSAYERLPEPPQRPGSKKEHC